MWKDIKGYEGIYQVSNDGKIKNKLGLITDGWVTDNYGHKKVRLYKDGKRKDFYLHRLVADAFVENDGNKPHVNHIDSNPLNNNASNLEWCTHAENMAHAKSNNRFHKEGVKVLDTSNGKIYDSIKEASDSIAMKPNTLVYKLLGKRPNNTTFVALQATHNHHLAKRVI